MGGLLMAGCGGGRGLGGWVGGFFGAGFFFGGVMENPPCGFCFALHRDLYLHLKQFENTLQGCSSLCFQVLCFYIFHLKKGTQQQQWGLGSGS